MNLERLRSVCLSFPGATEVFVTMLIEGQAAWLYGRRNHERASVSSPEFPTFLNTPTMVSHGASESMLPGLNRFPIASSPGQKRVAMLSFTSATPGVPTSSLEHPSGPVCTRTGRYFRHQVSGS